MVSITPEIYRISDKTNRHKGSNKANFTLKIGAIILLLLLCLGRSHAQEWVVFADSSTLSPYHWQGSLDKFALSPQGASLHDLSPKKTHNKAALLHTPKLPQVHTWQGEVSFHFALTSANTFVVLIAPLSPPIQEKEYTSCRYAYLSKEASGNIGLFEGNFCLYKDGQLLHKDKNIDREIVAPSAREALHFTSQRLHHLAWHITYSTEEGWQLYLKSSLQAEQKFILLGSNKSTPPPVEYKQGTFSGIALN